MFTTISTDAPVVTLINVFTVAADRQGELVADGKVHTVSKDQVIFIPAGMPHSLSNVSGEPFEIFEIYAPAGSNERVQTIEVPQADRMRFCLNDADILTLSRQALTAWIRCSVSPIARASFVCMSRQKAHPLICDARILRSSNSVGSRPHATISEFSALSASTSFELLNLAASSLGVMVLLRPCSCGSLSSAFMSVDGRAHNL